VTSSLSRADLLRRGAGGGALLLVSGTGLAALASPAGAATIPDGDFAYLRLLIAAELLKIDHATQALGSGKLSGDAAALVKQLLADDNAHYNGLAALMNNAGQTPATADDINFSYPKGAYASSASVLKLGRTLSTLSLGAYLGAIENVQTPGLRLPLGQIAANEAQHLSGYAPLLGKAPVGSAFAAALTMPEVSDALNAYES